jgi:hypothetical protein
MTVHDLNRHFIPFCDLMSSYRRVRFVENLPKSSDRPAHPAPRIVQTRLIQTSPPSQPQYQEIVENQSNEDVDLDASSRAEHLENVRLAAQRAHDAVMLARSMQADIRSSNAKMQRQGVITEKPPRPQPKQSLSATEPNTRTGQHAGPLLEKHVGPQLLDVVKDQNIMSMPMAWISNVLHLNQ